MNILGRLAFWGDFSTCAKIPVAGSWYRLCQCESFWL
jgi:hypothetical protein